MGVFFLLALGLAVVAAAPPSGPERIVGGSLTTVNQYPSAVALLASTNGLVYSQSCGGTVLNTRSVLTAAHCFMFLTQAWQWRSRFGSSYANSGGVVINSQTLIRHPSFNPNTVNNDVAIIRLSNNVGLSNVIQPASIAGPNYNVADNQAVWAIGWGRTSMDGQPSNQLRHVQIWTVNLNTCRSRYAIVGLGVTDQMLCSGWLDVGGRDQCQGDSGGPLFHNNVVVGVYSWGEGCALPFFPGVNARVSSFSNWIQNNA